MMEDVEQAYGTLGLKPGASLKEVFEAHEDLLALWDPDRLADRPRLRVKAPEQIREINAAYHILMEHLGPALRATPRRTPEPAPSPRERQGDLSPAAGLPSSAAPRKSSISLFDEVFSERAPKRSIRIPIWVVVVAVIVTGLLMAYLTQSPARREERPGSSPGARLPGSAGPIEEFAVSPDSGEARVGTEAQGKPSLTAPEQEISQGGETGPAAAVSAPKIQIAGSAEAPKKTADSSSTKRKSRPVLDRDEVIPSGKAAFPDQVPPETADRPSDAAVAAYRTLREKSDGARKLVNGEYNILQFVEWKVVQEGSSEILIDLTAHRSGGGSLTHFIWSVNPKTGTVKPMSQAARNLEADPRSR